MKQATRRDVFFYLVVPLLLLAFVLTVPFLISCAAHAPSRVQLQCGSQAVIRSRDADETHYACERPYRDGPMNCVPLEEYMLILQANGYCL